MDTISRRIFTSLAMENVFETSIVQQCKMLEANLSTCILAKCLSDPENAPGIVRSNRKHILRSDFQLLLSSSTDRHGSPAAAAQKSPIIPHGAVCGTQPWISGSKVPALCKLYSGNSVGQPHASSALSSSVKQWCLPTARVWNMRAYTIPLKWRIFPSITLSLFSQMQTLPFSPRVSRTVVVFGPLSTVINHSHSALSVACCITMCIHPLGHCYYIIIIIIVIRLCVYWSVCPSVCQHVCFRTVAVVDTKPRYVGMCN